MFMGEYHHSIDDKGRLIIPSKFRDELGKSFVVTRGFEDCLVVYSFTEWNKIVEKLNELEGMEDKELLEFIRPTGTWHIIGAGIMEVIDIKIFEDLMDNMEYYDIDLPIFPIEELLDNLETKNNKKEQKLL